MEAIRSLVTSVHTRSTRRHIPKDGILQFYGSKKSNGKQDTANLPLSSQYLCLFAEETFVHSASMFCSKRFILILVDCKLEASQQRQRSYKAKSILVVHSFHFLYTHHSASSKVTGVLLQYAILNISSAQASLSVIAIDLSDIHLYIHCTYRILSRVLVTIDGVWIGK
jgi:hypothetical protein